jgi:intracellular sulfur oxidation DsrE/DsrF family protein
MKPVVSDETLHAFVDGELDALESEKLIARMRDDSALAQRVCELRSLQSMLRVAYATPPRSKRTATSAPLRQRLQRYAAASVMLAAGLGGGWALRGMDGAGPVAMRPAAEPGAISLVRLTAEADPGRVMLHIDTAAPDKMRAVLDRAEQLLDEAERQDRVLQLEVIANSLGLNLLREEISPHAERIARMRARHANLQFVACNQSIARFRGYGEKVVLLPAVRTAPTAIGEIVTRLQQGWTYVRV